MRALTLRALACAAIVAAAAPAAGQAVRTVPVHANDLAYNPLTGRLYASVFDAGTIVEIDPIAGTVGASIPVGNFPNRLAMSDTGEYLYVGLDGLPGVVRVHLPTRTVGTPFPLGAPDPTLGGRAAEDMLVLPGNPDAVVVARRFFGIFPGHDGVAVYDNGVQRPVGGAAFNTLNNVIAFGTSPTRLYGYDNWTSGFGFQRMDIGPTGVTILESTSGLMNGAVDIEQFRRAAGGR
jgi:DNA-binding beta-propeller fold protein YncE